MDPLPLILLALAVVLPVFLVLLFGDRILKAMDRNRRKTRQSRRTRVTRALPLRDDVTRALLEAEERSDRLEAKIERSLDRYAHLSKRAGTSDSVAAALEATERALLVRESHFSEYIDIAWLQSEAIETLTKEVEQLLEFSNLGELDLKEVTRPERSAERLMKSLETASAKRQAIDDQIRAIGAGGTAGREPEQGPSGTSEWVG